MVRDTLCSIGILDIAILTGGLNIELNLVSILNCLQDMIDETRTLPPPAVLDQVSNSIGKGKGGGRRNRFTIFTLLRTAQTTKARRHKIYYTVGFLNTGFT